MIIIPIILSLVTSFYLRLHNKNILPAKIRIAAFPGSANQNQCCISLHALIRYKRHIPISIHCDFHGATNPLLLHSQPHTPVPLIIPTMVVVSKPGGGGGGGKESKDLLYSTVYTVFEERAEPRKREHRGKCKQTTF